MPYFKILPCVTKSKDIYANGTISVGMLIKSVFSDRSNCHVILSRDVFIEENEKASHKLELLGDFSHEGPGIYKRNYG